MHKILSVILILLLSFFSLSFIAISDALAQSRTQPTYSFDLASKTTSDNSDLTITLSVEEGQRLVNNVDINMPIGWDVRGGADVSQGAKVGSGTGRIKHLGTVYDLNVEIFNEQETLGARARWKIVIGDEPFISPEGILFWDWTGSAADGYVFNINSPIISELETPLQINFTFLGVTTSGEIVLANPENAKAYVWSFDLNFEDGETSRLQTSIPISSKP